MEEATKAQVTGTLSSRVMNMKFMRFTNSKDSIESDSSNSSNSTMYVHQKLNKNFSDNSEWKLARHQISENSTDETQKVKNVIRIKRNPLVISNIGIANVKRETITNNIVRGRRIVGEPPIEAGKRTAESNYDTAKTEEDDSYEPDMDQLLKQSKKNNDKQNKSTNKKNKKMKYKQK